MKSLLSHIVVAFLAALFSFFLFRSYYTMPGMDVLPTHVIPTQRILTKTAQRSFNNPDFSLIANRCIPAVVNITSLSATNYPIGSGSGVIVSSDGYIVTNQHVIEDASTLRITLPNKRKLDAEVIGIDSQTDLALIKVSAHNLFTLNLGNSDQLGIGEWVLAIGHPFNFNATVTAGIVSAKARNINILGDDYSIESFIQTDAVVNPGNSGGALINTAGELIGINTAILTESGVSEGYSFAIPSNLIRKVITDLREFGQVRRAVLGVSILDVNDEIADDLGLLQVEGVYIQSISKGGTAYYAGMTKGDVILSVNNVPTSTIPQLQEQIALYRPGDLINIEFMRAGKRFSKENIMLRSFNAADLKK